MHKRILLKLFIFCSLFNFISSSNAQETNNDLGYLTPIINLILDQQEENTLNPPIPPLTSSGPHIRIESTDGDFIGQGLSYEYTTATTVFDIGSNFDNGISIRIEGTSLNTPSISDNWTLDLSNGSTRLTVGQFDNASRFPFNNSNENGLNFSGNGRGCNSLIGEFTIFEVEYDGDELTKLTADFTQYCEGRMDAPLRGSIRFDASLPTEEPAPNAGPITTTLFPEIEPLTTAGPIVRIESDEGDFVGQGLTYEYVRESTTFNIGNNFDNGITISIDGASTNSPDRNDFWTLNLASAEDRLTVGQYNNAARFPFNAALQNGLSFSGNGRGCNTLTGEFTIFEIEYDGDELIKLTADFTQFCGNNATAAIRGSIRFDSTLPLENELDPEELFPEIPPLITSGPHIRLESDEGDFIGRGLDYEYTTATTVFDISDNFDNGITIRINGTSLNTPSISDNWTLNLSNGSTQLTVGQFDNASRFPFNDSDENGLSFSGNGRGCNTLSGEFTIFEVEYDGDELTKLTADFTQFCEGNNLGPALRGSIRFDASLPTEDPAPNAGPITTTLFPEIQPLTNTGPVVRLESEQGDSIGRGLSYEYTTETATFTISDNFDNGINIRISGFSTNSPEVNDSWTLDLSSAEDRLTVGQYNDAARFPFNAALQNGLSFSGNGRGCNTLTGAVSYTHLPSPRDLSTSRMPSSA